MIKTPSNLLKNAAAAGLIMMLAWTGCGYTQKSALPENVKTIYITPVQNKITLSELYAYVPGLEVMMNNAMTDRFNKDGNLRVVNDPDKADWILEVNLVRFEQSGVRFTTLESVEEYRMFITVSARLMDGKSKEEIWAENDFSGDADYHVSDVRPLAREEAAGRAVERLARNIVDRVVEDW